MSVDLKGQLDSPVASKVSIIVLVHLRRIYRNVL